MKNQEKKQNLIVKVAYQLGSRTVGKCVIWFNQPTIPEKLKQEVEHKQK